MRKESGYPPKTAYDTERIWLSTQFGVIYENHLPIHLIWDGYTENFSLNNIVSWLCFWAAAVLLHPTERTGSLRNLCADTMLFPHFTSLSQEKASHYLVEQIMRIGVRISCNLP